MYEAANDLLYQILSFREIGIKLVRVPLYDDHHTNDGDQVEQAHGDPICLAPTLCPQRRDSATFKDGLRK